MRHKVTTRPEDTTHVAELLSEVGCEIINTTSDSVSFTSDKSPRGYLYYLVDRDLIHGHEVTDKNENT